MESLSPENNEVYPPPRFETLSPRKLDDKYPWLVVLSLQMTLVLVPLFHFFAEPVVIDDVRRLFWPLAAVWMALSIYFWFHCRAKGYQLREHDVSLYTGLIFKKTIIQPVSRLQHIEVAQGPLERLAGLATLKLFSAGGAMHSLAIPGLKKELAEGLKLHILDSKSLGLE